MSYMIWREWFAWYPVRIRGVRVWLKTVTRRVNPHTLDWEYRA